MNTFDYIFKYIVIGDINVGKTSIISNFLNPEKFEQNY